MNSKTIISVAIFSLLVGLGGYFLIGIFRSREDLTDVTFDIDHTGREMVFIARGQGGRDIYHLDLTSKLVQRVTKTPLWERTPKFSPDGREILFAAGTAPMEPSHIFKCAVQGGTTIQLTFGDNTYDRFPSMSPNGKEIVFARALRRIRGSFGGWNWDQWHIFKCDANGSNCVRLTNRAFEQISGLTWLSNGKGVVFSHGGVTLLSIIDNREILIVPDGHFSTISQDGKWIAYIASGADKYDFEVWTTTLDGKQTRRVSDNHSYNRYPRFMPDGNNILFLSDPLREHQPELWTIGNHGGDMERIAGSELFRNPLKSK